MDKNIISRIEATDLEIRPSQEHDFSVLKSWFSNAKDLLLWGGASFRYAASDEEFLRSLHKKGYKALSFYYHSELVGFGQYQLHQGYAHLGRVAIAPKFQGMGLSYYLVTSLVEQAKIESVHSIKQVSLYVYKANKIAFKVYTKVGFEIAVPPKGITAIPACHFMLLTF
jgi:ribosomal protein S18 acetylase RimI-like enzyme